MYSRGNESKRLDIPFIIECGNCRSHDVEIYINEFGGTIDIECNECGSHLNSITYNEETYKLKNKKGYRGCYF